MHPWFGQAAKRPFALRPLPASTARRSGRRGGGAALLPPVCAELLEQPSPCRAGWIRPAINREDLGVLRTVTPPCGDDAREAPGVEVILHHVQRHPAPAKAGAEEGVLGAEIGETPGPPAEDAEVHPLGEAAAIG